MFCRKCGRKLETGAAYCRYCREPADTAEICGGFWGLVRSAEAQGNVSVARERRLPDPKREEAEKAAEESGRLIREKEEENRYLLHQLSELKERRRRSRRVLPAAGALLLITGLFLGLMLSKSSFSRQENNPAAGADGQAAVSDPANTEPGSAEEPEPGEGQQTSAAKGSAAEKGEATSKDPANGKAQQTLGVDGSSAEEGEAASKDSANGKAQQTPSAGGSTTEAGEATSNDSANGKATQTPATKGSTVEAGEASSKDPASGEAQKIPAAKGSMEEEEVPPEDSGEEHGNVSYVRQVYDLREQEDKDELYSFIRKLGSAFKDDKKPARITYFEKENESPGRLKTVKICSAGEDELASGKETAELVIRYVYEHDEESGVSGDILTKKTIRNKESEENLEVQVEYDPERLVIGSGGPTTFTVEEKYVDNTGAGHAEPEGTPYSGIKYSYVYNARYSEYHLDRKEYSGEGPGGESAAVYGGFIKANEYDPDMYGEMDDNTYVISETYVLGGKERKDIVPGTGDGSAETAKQVIEVNGHKYDEIRYFYDGNKNRLVEYGYYRNNLPAIGPDGFHRMKCSYKPETDPDDTTRQEEYFDAELNPVNVKGEKLFRTPEELYLVFPESFAEMFFRQDLNAGIYETYIESQRNYEPDPDVWEDDWEDEED